MVENVRVMIVGLGYVGLPLAIAFANGGCEVVGIDNSQDKIRQLAAGRSYIEGVDDAALVAGLSSGAIVFMSECPSDWESAIIAVPTPLDENRLPDLTAVLSAATAVGRTMRRGCLVVLESTTYPGTTREVLVPLLEQESGLVAGKDFHVAFSPERVDPGNATFGITNTPKLVGGLDSVSLSVAVHLYERAVERVVPVSSPEVAELSKLLENTYRHVNIALVNELAVVAHELDIDVWEVIEAAATKPFGYHAFKPGPGVGGHCLPIDPAYLSWRVRSSLNRSFRFIELATEVNDLMPGYVVQRLLLLCNDRGWSLSGRRVGVLGRSYKANVSDTRESPAAAIVEGLTSLGAVPVVIDPLVSADDVRNDILSPWTEQTLRSLDIAVLVTDHDVFLQEQHRLVDVPIVFDTRGVLRLQPNVVRL